VARDGRGARSVDFAARAFIVEWIYGTAGGCQFRVAPAELVFHDVTDPVVSIRWSIELNWPAGGEIAFGARGFTQTLLAEPILTERQHLTRAERRDLL